MHKPHQTGQDQQSNSASQTVHNHITVNINVSVENCEHVAMNAAPELARLEPPLSDVTAPSYKSPARSWPRKLIQSLAIGLAVDLLSPSLNLRLAELVSWFVAHFFQC